MAKTKGLEGVVAAETNIGYVDGEQGRLVYRGYEAKALAVSRRYEEVACLLWHGALPEPGVLPILQARFAGQRELPPAIRALLDALPASVGAMGAIQAATAVIGEAEGWAWPPSAAQAERLTALLPTLVAYRARSAAGLAPVAPDPTLGHAANFLYMLNGVRPADAQAEALNAYLILTMEHGLNASTFAGRVVLSTQSDLGAAVSGAVGAMKGPLHGGAPSEVLAMLDDIGTPDRAEPWIRETLVRGERLMGFGHRIYKTEDPRAAALRVVASRLAGDDPAFDLAVRVEDVAIRLLQAYKPGRKLYTNVEFYAAAILRALAMPPELFTPTFTIGRVAGWTAHLLEQASDNRIFRPQSVYTGPFHADP